MPHSFDNDLETTKTQTQLTGEIGTNIETKSSFQYVGFWKRLLAYLIDFILFVPCIYFWGSIELYSYQERTIVPIVVYNLIPIVLHLFFLVRFGGTPGKILA